MVEFVFSCYQTLISSQLWITNSKYGNGQLRVLFNPPTAKGGGGWGGGATQQQVFPIFLGSGKSFIGKL